MREAGFLLVILVPCFAAAGFCLLQLGVIGRWDVLVWSAGICITCGFLALLVQELAFRWGNGLSGSLSTIGLRTICPAIALGWLMGEKPEFMAHHLFRIFVACYLLTLAVETILSVCLIARWDTRQSISGSPTGI